MAGSGETGGDRFVRVTDVSPRDGLQNEPGRVPTADKARLVRAVAAAGFDEVEVTSFVSPKWVPQLGDAAELCAMLAEDRPERVLYSALVPNMRGLERLLEVNRLAVAGVGGRRLIGKASVFAAASETFSRKNTNGSIDEVLERFVPIAAEARGAGLQTRGYISCAVACPYEGAVEPAAVAAVARRLREIGIEEIDLGDTIGAGTPETIGAVVAAVADELGGTGSLTLHLHDTRGTAAACVVEALRLGVRSFDGAAGGLGGCPYAGGEDGGRAPGNIASSLLVRTIEHAGYQTAVDLEALAAADRLAHELSNAAAMGERTGGGA